jgi:hypothetical protein
MHDCQKYREEWLDAAAEEITGCEKCRQFCTEAAALFQVMSPAARPAFEMPDGYWSGFEDRLRSNLANTNRAGTSWMSWRLRIAAAAAAAVAAVWLGFRVSSVPDPGVAESGVAEPGVEGHIEFVDTHIEGLDLAVVDFLRQSELDLRTFTKIKPSYTEDIEDARRRASRALEGIAGKKKAAGDFAPVRIALDEYESVLREIKNLDSSRDISDIQKRIHRNGLVASLNAYQPRVLLVSQR